MRFLQLPAVTAAALLASLPVAHADPAAEAFLHSIYDAYDGENGGGVMLDDVALPNYFTPHLVGLIQDDIKTAQANSEVPKLDGDPFIDAQDWKISGLDIKVEDRDTSHALGTVTYKNFDQLQVMKLDLVKGANGWRIEEISGPRGKLTAIFQH